jgi:hypothetical protein
VTVAPKGGCTGGTLATVTVSYKRDPQ